MLESYFDGSYGIDQFGFQDPAYILLNTKETWTGLGIYLINLISAIFFSLGLMYFARHNLGLG
jgi:hypothetical protein